MLFQEGNLELELQNVKNGLIFESIVLICLFFMLTVIYRFSKKRPSKLTKLLLWIFVAYAFGIFFSWLAKLLYWTGGYTSLQDIPQDTEGYYFYKLIFKYRISFTFILLGAYFNYLFKASVFEKEMNKLEKWIISIYCIISSIFNFSVLPPDNDLMDLISFGLMFLFMVIVYLPFIISTFKLSKRIDEKIYRRGLRSLGWMGICLILVTVCMVLDRAMIIFLNSDGYTFFYYFGWINTIIALNAAYLGFIRPSAK